MNYFNGCSCEDNGKFKDNSHPLTPTLKKNHQRLALFYFCWIFILIEKTQIQENQFKCKKMEHDKSSE